MLAEPLGTIDVPLDTAWVAEMLRRRLDADGGLYPEGMTLAVLPPGRKRGRLLVAGGPVEPGRSHAVAATDWELGNLGGYALPEWGLEIRYDFPTIVREAVEDHLRGRR